MNWLSNRDNPPVAVGHLQSVVTTDDPVAYVQALEPSCELEVEQTPEGLLIKTERGGLWIKYEFTED